MGEKGVAYIMIELNGKAFDWDAKKNLINIEKHGVSFKMAAASFFDPHAITLDDDYHSQEEDRFILIGINKYDKLLTVCHCYREEARWYGLYPQESQIKLKRNFMEVYNNGTWNGVRIKRKARCNTDSPKPIL